VDVAHPVPENVGESNQNGQADAPQLEVIDQLLDVDGPAGLLGDVGQDVPIGAHGEVALPPASNIVKF
jgi:hypothetical protein